MVWHGAPDQVSLQKNEEQKKKLLISNQLQSLSGRSTSLTLCGPNLHIIRTLSHSDHAGVIYGSPKPELYMQRVMFAFSL